MHIFSALRKNAFPKNNTFKLVLAILINLLFPLVENFDKDSVCLLYITEMCQLSRIAMTTNRFRNSHFCKHINKKKHKSVLEKNKSAIHKTNHSEGLMKGPRNPQYDGSSGFRGPSITTMLVNEEFMSVIMK